MQTGFIQNVVDSYVANQPWYQRRKNTIIAVAGLVLQVAQVAAVYATGAPHYVSLILAGIIGVCEALVHATAKGAVTPSMGERLEQEADFIAPAAPAQAEPVSPQGTTATIPGYRENSPVDEIMADTTTPTVADYYAKER